MKTQPVIALALTLTLAGSFTASAATLTTEIPPEIIEGTPMPIKVQNLVPAPKQAPSLDVPDGTVLLSEGKEVTGSDDFPIIGELEYITDGDKIGGEGYFTELMDGLQWIQIDLEASHEIAAPSSSVLSLCSITLM